MKLVSGAYLKYLMLMHRITRVDVLPRHGVLVKY